MDNLEISRRALDLALAIYRLAGRLPEGEPLAAQLKAAGNEVVGDLVMENFIAVRKRVEILQNYFIIANAQKWVPEENWQILTAEYQKLSAMLEISVGQEEEREKEEKIFEKHDGVIESHNIRQPEKKKENSGRLAKLSQRQEKILNELRLKGTVKTSYLTSLFGKDASERTLRNDLSMLIKKGLIRKRGAGRGRSYALKNPAINKLPS